MFTGVHIYLTGILFSLQAPLSYSQVCVYVYLTDILSKWQVVCKHRCPVYKCACIFDRYFVQSAGTAVLFTGVHVYLTGILCSLQTPLSCLQVCMYIWQVFCVNNRCLPRWQRDSYWDLNKDGGRGYNWTTETVSLHLVIPKPIQSFVSPLALKNSKNMIGDVGRRILKKSGRLSILDQV